MVTTDRSIHRLSTAIQSATSSVSSVSGNISRQSQSSNNANAVYRITVEGLLANGQLKVDINGQSMQLRLPNDLESGQQLELTSLTDPNKKLFLKADTLIISNDRVMTAKQWVATQRQVYDTDLSSSAKLIGSLTAQASKEEQTPVRIVSAKPLVASANVNRDVGQLISTALKDSIQSSGLFYESHQAEWVSGRYSLAQLRAEPQAGLADQKIVAELASTKQMTSEFHKLSAATPGTRFENAPLIYTRPSVVQNLTSPNSPEVMTPTNQPRPEVTPPSAPATQARPVEVTQQPNPGVTTRPVPAETGGATVAQPRPEVTIPVNQPRPEVATSSAPATQTRPAEVTQQPNPGVTTRPVPVEIGGATVAQPRPEVAIPVNQPRPEVAAPSAPATQPRPEVATSSAPATQTRPVEVTQQPNPGVTTRPVPVEIGGATVAQPRPEVTIPVNQPRPEVTPPSAPANQPRPEVAAPSAPATQPRPEVATPNTSANQARPAEVTPQPNSGVTTRPATVEVGNISPGLQRPGEISEGVGRPVVNETGHSVTTRPHIPDSGTLGAASTRAEDKPASAFDRTMFARPSSSSETTTTTANVQHTDNRQTDAVRSMARITADQESGRVLSQRLSEELTGTASGYRVAAEDVSIAARALGTSRSGRGSGQPNTLSVIDDDAFDVEMEKRPMSTSNVSDMTSRFSNASAVFSQRYAGKARGTQDPLAAMNAQPGATMKGIITGGPGQAAILAVDRLHGVEGGMASEFLPAQEEGEGSQSSDVKKSADSFKDTLADEQKRRFASEGVVYTRPGDDKNQQANIQGRQAQMSAQTMRHRLNRFMEAAAMPEIARSSNTSVAHPETIPLMRQQMQLLSDPRLCWGGEVWPGQWMDLEIEPDQSTDHERAVEDDEIRAWKTTMKLTFPHLGEVVAVLHVDDQDVKIWLRSPDHDTTDQLQNAFQTLYQRMTALNIPLSTLQIDQHADAPINSSDDGAEKDHDGRQ